MPTLANGQAGAALFQAGLVAALEDVYAAHYSRYGGADVVTEADEPTDVDNQGKPYIVLALTVDEYDPQWLCWRAQFSATCKANDFNGGRTGADNATASQMQLAADMRDYVAANLAALRDAGLLNALLDGPRQSVQQGESGNVYVAAHTLTFHYTTTEDP